MNRIKELRNKAGMKQIDFCKQIGVTQGALSGWENGKFEPDNAALFKMADIFGVTVGYLLGRTVESNVKPVQLPRGEWVRIPVLGRVAAGMPIEAVEEIIDYEEIPESMARTGEFFALSIQGDSMKPRINSGDVVIVKKQPDVDSGQIAIVMVNGDDAVCKKVVKHGNGISLISSNPTYDPMFFTEEEIESLPVTILGKVVELRGKFK